MFVPDSFHLWRSGGARRADSTPAATASSSVVLVSVVSVLAFAVFSGSMMLGSEIRPLVSAALDCWGEAAMVLGCSTSEDND